VLLNWLLNASRLVVDNDGGADVSIQNDIDLLVAGEVVLLLVYVYLCCGLRLL
jgi:hypothetical protein